MSLLVVHDEDVSGHDGRPLSYLAAGSDQPEDAASRAAPVRDGQIGAHAAQQPPRQREPEVQPQVVSASARVGLDARIEDLRLPRLGQRQQRILQLDEGVALIVARRGPQHARSPG